MSCSSNRKKILISNDDGINSEGIKVLSEKLSAVCDVYIMAPASNQSAVSSRISLYKDLEFVRYDEKTYSCSGTPADCVISAFCSDFFGGAKFDAVFSGINAGPNMGTDTVYSGTIAAARQGVLYGVPAVAVSLESPHFDYDNKDFNFVPLAEFCAKNLDQLISLCRDDLFVSINATSADEYNDVVFASMCKRQYHDRVEAVETGEGRYTGKCIGGKITVEGAENCDYNVARSGKISISLLHANPSYEVYDGDIKFNF
ncbi:MAG: 5'/3'-nucleotidase SurE [Treponema sp.]|nr:5'/3'-nucleotidase SurE [Candidatus Treponema equifaecale]